MFSIQPVNLVLVHFVIWFLKIFLKTESESPFGFEKLERIKETFFLFLQIFLKSKENIKTDECTINFD